jgi:hypothetical protein
LLEAGWAVAPGRRYRLTSDPAIRVTISKLHPRDAAGMAGDVARALTPPKRTYTA